MPELPEVETVRRGLLSRLVGRHVTAAWAFDHPKFVAAHEAVGHQVTGLDRQGKYLLVQLYGPSRPELIVHLGMTGSLQVHRLLPDDPYIRAWWQLESDLDADTDASDTDPSDGDEVETAEGAATSAGVLVFRDVRRFGRLAFAEHSAYQGTLAAQGPDALASDLSAEAVWERMRSSNRRVKTQLLSQRPLAGVGNIYADEALWLARVNPRVRRLSRVRTAELVDALRHVMTASLGNGGTTLRDYRDANGDAGTNQGRLACYGRAGEPCLRCGDELRRVVLDGRTTTFCPTCQSH